MHNKTTALLERVNQAHDWDEGEVSGGSGLQLFSTDTCRICSLARHFFSDRQNHGPDPAYTFTREGLDLTLRDAAALDPCI